MRRFSRMVLLVLLVELVIAAAVGTRVRRQLERPVTYLGSLPDAPLGSLSDAPRAGLS
jgi:hypothetical protein